MQAAIGTSIANKDYDYLYEYLNSKKNLGIVEVFSRDNINKILTDIGALKILLFFYKTTDEDELVTISIFLLDRRITESINLMFQEKYINDSLLNKILSHERGIKLRSVEFLLYILEMLYMNNYEISYELTQTISKVGKYSLDYENDDTYSKIDELFEKLEMPRYVRIKKGFKKGSVASQNRNMDIMASYCSPGPIAAPGY